jgi:phosphoglycolate phosphatase
MFDYDGVIVDSLNQFTIDFISSCHENGLCEVKDQRDILNLFDDNAYTSMVFLGASVDTVNKILKSFEYKSKETLYQLQLFNGIKDVLDQIAKHNKVFIITSNLSKNTTDLLKSKGVTSFEDVIGADVEKSKIKKIQYTINKYPNFIGYYVGDTRGDVLEGKRANVKTIAVTWGWHEANKLNEVNPDYLAHSPMNLIDILCK